MFGRKINRLSLLALVLWIFGVASCWCACADDDHAAERSADHHCVVDCACQAVADSPPAAALNWQPPRGYHVSSETPLKLSRFVPAIFQPPRA
jgi:hypothetical protein